LISHRTASRATLSASGSSGWVQRAERALAGGALLSPILETSRGQLTKRKNRMSSRIGDLLLPACLTCRNIPTYNASHAYRRRFQCNRQSCKTANP
jgi:hypothetical protein